MKKMLLLLGVLSLSFLGFGQVQPISNLETSVGSNNMVFLDWDIPIDATEAFISWSDMIENDESGVATGQCATDQAVHFDASDLIDFVGWKMKEVSVILSSYDTMSGIQDQNYYIRIWKGTDNIMEQVYEKEIMHPEYAVPLTVALDSVVYIEEDQNLCVGYHIDRYREFPWVIDNGPSAPEGKGLWFRLYHKDSNDDCVMVSSWDNSWPSPIGNLCVSATLIHPNRDMGNGSIVNQLTGYRVYRDGELIQEIPYSFVTYFTDTEFARGTDVEYCVTAVYGDEESESVCATATITGIGETVAEDGITVSPNPTHSLVRIEGVTIAEVQVYNAIGQLVKTIQNANEIDMNQLSEGIYLLRITATDGSLHSRKLTLCR